MIAELESLEFKKVSWIYLNSTGKYKTKIVDDGKVIEWTPSRNAAGMAKATELGNIVENDRTILVDFDSKILGLYRVKSPLMQDVVVKLELWREVPSRVVSRPSGSTSGSYLSKRGLIEMLTQP